MPFRHFDIWDFVVWPARADLDARQDAIKHVVSCRRQGVSPFSRPVLNRWGDELVVAIPVLVEDLLEDAAAGSADAVAADLATSRRIPTRARTEFHPPRLLRGLDVTLSPRLLPVPSSRSCHVN